MADSSTNGGLSLETAPSLWTLLYPVRQYPRAHKRRLLTYVDSASDLAQQLLGALPELGRRGIADALAAHELATLGRLAVAAPQGMSAKVLPVLRQIVDRRWAEIGPAMVATILLDPHYGHEVIQAFPAVARSSEFVDGLGEAQQAGVLQQVIWRFNLTGLMAPSLDQLRRLLPVVGGEYDGDLSAQLLKAAAERDGWTPWLTLFGILFHAEELARDRAPEDPPTRSSQSWHDEAHEPVRRTVWRSLHSSARARTIARLLEDLRAALRDAPRDLWETYARQLAEAVDGDSTWRAATVEALLWVGAEHNRRLAVFAAKALMTPRDLPILEGLFGHPDRRTEYEARGLTAAIEARPVVADHTLGAERPPALAGLDSGLSNTWIGQAVVEQLISDEIAKLEVNFARDYPDHHRIGEEKLSERFFSELGVRLETLSEKLAAMARDSGAATRSEILVRYRPVDKPEEGAAGIVRPGQDAPPDKFSADLCLVVEATLNGAPLAKRATLVQAKRLYAANLADPGAGWEASYQLKPEQTDALLKQTESSFYLFQGPGFDGRGLPIISARLVDELATHQGPSRTRVSTTAVGRASQSFAEWFTYQLVALRTGDPCQPLVNKALGGPGSAPYDLARFGVVEVEVRIGEPLKEGG